MWFAKRGVGLRALLLGWRRPEAAASEAAPSELLSAPELPLAPGRRRRWFRLPDEVRLRRAVSCRALLPDAFAEWFTEGERAVLAVVAREVALSGCCELSLDRIAAEAGVRRSLTELALRKARARGLIVSERRRLRAFRQLPNRVRIVAEEWGRVIGAPTKGGPTGGSMAPG